MVDLCGKLVGKYTRPMDESWVSMINIVKLSPENLGESNIAASNICKHCCGEMVDVKTPNQPQKKSEALKNLVNIARLKAATSVEAVNKK